MGVDLATWYPASAVPSVDNAVLPTSANVQAAGKVTQSAEGSFSASGHPAVWFLIIVAGVLVLYHLD